MILEYLSEGLRTSSYKSEEFEFSGKLSLEDAV